ncbi:septal ring lytic transglycosylase RlpA family protein [soil metagenome]
MQGRIFKSAVIVAATALLAACASAGAGAGIGATFRPTARSGYVPTGDPAPIVSGTMRAYQVRGHWYQPISDASHYDEVGMASWYGDQFNGRPTSSGERFDMHALTAAHKTLPLPAMVEVTNLSNGRTVVLRVNDRGPFVDSRIIDLSRGAAESIGLLAQGVGQVRVRYLGPAPRGGGGGLQIASSASPGDGPRRNAPLGPSSRVASTEASRYWIQAGSFADPTLAHLAAESLGDQARVNPAQIDGRRLYRVMLGPWSDANTAETARQAVVARGVHDALLVSGG